MKNASGQAMFSRKRAHEMRMHAFEQGLIPLEDLRDEDIFEIEHHHLLQCLETATVLSLIHIYKLQVKICYSLLT